MDDTIVISVSRELERVITDKLEDLGFMVVPCQRTYCQMFETVQLLDPLIVIIDRLLWSKRLGKDIGEAELNSCVMLIDEQKAATKELLCIEIVKNVEKAIKEREYRFEKLEEYCSEVIANELDELCITPNYQGYRYIREIVTRYSMNMAENRAINCKLYIDPSEKFGVTTASVEHSIRTTVQKSWNKADRSMIAKYLGKSFANRDRTPTNKEYLYAMAEKLSEELRRYKKKLRDMLLGNYM